MNMTMTVAESVERSVRLMPTTTALNAYIWHLMI